MNAFPGRAQQLPSLTPATAQPAGAASHAASLAAAQPAAPPQQSASHLPAKSQAGPPQIQAQSTANDSIVFQLPAQLPTATQLGSCAEHGDALRHQVGSAADEAPSQPAQKLQCPESAQVALQGRSPKAVRAPEAAMLSGSELCGPEKEPVPGAAMIPNSEHNGLGTMPVSEAAVPAGNQHTAIPASQQQTQTPLDPHRPPSILQDLRNAAAQGCPHQPQGPSSHSASLSSQQEAVEPVQPPQPAFPELQSSQETTSMQAHRLSTAAQSAGTFASAPEEAAAPHADPPCPDAHAAPALLPFAQGPHAIPVHLGATAGSNQDRQLAVAGQTVANGSSAFAEHSDSLSIAPVLEAAATAVQEKQPAVRSQRLSEKKAAAAQAAAQAAADAVVQAAAVHEQDTLAAAVKQTGLGLLAPRMAVASSTVPLVLAECLASNRSKRVPGGDPLEVSSPPPPPPIQPLSFRTGAHPVPLLSACCMVNCMHHPSI